MLHRHYDGSFLLPNVFPKDLLSPFTGTTEYAEEKLLDISRANALVPPTPVLGKDAESNVEGMSPKPELLPDSTGTWVSQGCAQRQRAHAA